MIRCDRSTRLLTVIALALGLLHSSRLSAQTEPGLRLGPSLIAPTPSSVRVWWQADADGPNHRVEFGVTKALGQVAQWGGTPAGSKPATTAMPVVELSGLKPATRYFYRVVSGETSSKTYSFQLPDPSKEFRVVIWGENQGGKVFAEQTVPKITSLAPSLLVCTGDIADLGFKNASWEQDFYLPAASLVRSVPWYAVRGNHDGEFPLALKMLPLPGNNHWYATTYGPVRWVFLDSNLPFGEDTDQLRWLQKETKGEEWSKAGFRFVVLHHPPFNTVQSSKGDDGSRPARRVLVPLLEDRRADLVLSGHAHVYERGSRERPDGGRTYYVVTGGGGGQLDTVKTADWPHIHITVQKHHVVVADVREREVRFQAVDVATGEEIDSFPLPREDKSP